MKKINSTWLLFILAAVVVAGVIGAAIYKNNAPSAYDDFAQCLTDQGVVMYGAWWCPHCENQKEMFGTAFRNINYVECSPGQTRTMSQECRNEGIEGFPTWRFPDDGQDLRGEIPLATLAERAGCELPEEG